MAIFSFFTLQPVLVVTTGKQTADKGRHSPLNNVSSSLQTKGAIVIAVGVGNDVVPSELSAIASAAHNVFTVSSSEVLQDKLRQIKDALCEGTVYS